MTYGLWSRKQTTINTDPQHRCYNGCHASSELRWTEWQCLLEYEDLATIVDTMQTFQRINPKEQYKICNNGDDMHTRTASKAIRTIKQNGIRIVAIKQEQGYFGEQFIIIHPHINDLFNNQDKIDEIIKQIGPDIEFNSSKIAFIVR